MKNEAGAHADRSVALPFAAPASRWNDEAANPKSPEELLLYRSNLLGSDLTVTNFGGGNTSAKLLETDPLTNEAVDVKEIAEAAADWASRSQELAALRDGVAALRRDVGAVIWVEGEPGRR